MTPAIDTELITLHGNGKEFIFDTNRTNNHTGQQTLKPPEQLVRWLFDKANRKVVLLHTDGKNLVLRAEIKRHE